MQRKYVTDSEYNPHYNTAGYQSFDYPTRSAPFTNTSNSNKKIEKFVITEYDLPIEEMPVKFTCEFANEQSLTDFFKICQSNAMLASIKWHSQGKHLIKSEYLDSNYLVECLKAVHQIDAIDDDAMNKLNSFGFNMKNDQLNEQHNEEVSLRPKF